MEIDTSKCHISMRQLIAYNKKFWLAHHTVIQGQAAISMPMLSKDKGFTGLGLDMQYSCMHQTSALRIFQIHSACTIAAL